MVLELAHPPGVLDEREGVRVVPVERHRRELRDLAQARPGGGHGVGPGAGARERRGEAPVPRDRQHPDDGQVDVLRGPQEVHVEPARLDEGHERVDHRVGELTGGDARQRRRPVPREEEGVPLGDLEERVHRGLGEARPEGAPARGLEEEAPAPVTEIIGEVPGKGESLEAIAIPKDQSQCQLEPMS